MSCTSWTFEVCMDCQTTPVSYIVAVYYECFALVLFGGIS